MRKETLIFRLAPTLMQKLPTHIFPRLLIGLSTICLVASLLQSFSALQISLLIVPELTDAAYYVFQTRYAASFPIQLHPFGIYWISLFGENNIFWNRIIHLSLIVGTPIFLMWRIASIHNGPMLHKAFLILVPSCAFLSLYSGGHVDPNYNSMTASIACLALGVAVAPFERISPQYDNILRPFLLGSLAPLLVMSKISSGPIVGLLVAYFYFVSIRKGSEPWAQKLMRVTLFGLSGFSIILLLFYIRGFGDPVSMIKMIHQSIKLFSHLQSHELSVSDVILKLKVYFEYLVFHFDKDVWSYFSLLLSPLFIGIFLLPKSAKPNYANIGAFVFLCLTIWLGYKTFTNFGKFDGYRAMAQDFARVLFLFMVGSALVKLTASRSFEGFELFPISACALLIVLGTNNSYQYFITSYAGFFAIGAVIILNGDYLFYEPQENKLYALFQQCLAFGVVVSTSLIITASMGALQNQPYRFFGQINEKMDSVSFGVPGERFYSSALLAKSYGNVAHLKQKRAIGPQSQPIVDWTGRSPGIPLHLGLRPLQTAWLVGTYPGEDKFATEVLGGAKQNDIAEAWIIVSDKMTRSSDLLIEILAATGRRFPEDYIKVGEFFNPNQKSQNIILRPHQPCCMTSSQ